jgi:hypothetical protein
MKFFLENPDEFRSGHLMTDLRNARPCEKALCFQDSFHHGSLNERLRHNRDEVRSNFPEIYQRNCFHGRYFVRLHL